MSDEVDYFKEKLRRFPKNWKIICGCILFFVLVGLGYLATHKPVLTVDADQAGVYIKNHGDIDAVIYRVDGFWYRAGKVALLANMPDIHQRVESGGSLIRLEIPNIPAPSAQPPQRSPVYMKLALRYRIPGVWIFRFTTPIYFRYDATYRIWELTENIPPRYRALGNLAMGKIEKVELSFQ